LLGTAGVDALTLLKRDHDAVRALFAGLAETSGAARVEAVREIAAEVILHSQLEEEFFYAALDGASDREARQITIDARSEHGLVEDLMERLLGLDPRQAAFEDAVRELERKVQEHAREEERRTFPVARRVLGEARLEAIGRDIAARRARLDAAA
jgi:hemerythrin superfamily protein